MLDGLAGSGQTAIDALTADGPLWERLQRGPRCEQLTDDVWWFRLGWYPPLCQNAYLVDDGEVTLVDSGLPWDAGLLRAYLDRAGYAVGDVDRVLVTHYDLDHVGGAMALADELSAPVSVGVRDLALANGDATPSLTHHKGAFHRGLRQLYPLPGSLDVTPVEDGDTVGGFDVYETPGHNPGHVVYVAQAVDAAFLGDLVWETEGALTTPVWLDSYDLAELADSVARLADRVTPFELACMGHGEPLRAGGSAALSALAERQ
jgi:glyoxylase-like metal-dependent hydrolase (beta-lactamase superfamily II)